MFTKTFTVYYLYLITNEVNNKVYIGQALNVSK